MLHDAENVIVVGGEVRKRGDAAVLRHVAFRLGVVSHLERVADSIRAVAEIKSRIGGSAARSGKVILQLHEGGLCRRQKSSGGDVVGIPVFVVNLLYALSGDERAVDRCLNGRVRGYIFGNEWMVK